MTEADSVHAAGRVGEVVRASTSDFVTQCYRLYGAPPLGCLVKCDADTTAYGVVAEVTTESLDPGRTPVARGEHEESVDAIYRSNPQIERLYTTHFKAVTVGHRMNGQIRSYVAPSPPRIHSFVSPADEDELRSLSGSLDFVPVLLDQPSGARDDVTASFLKLSSAVHEDPEEYLVAAGKELAVLLTGQLHRLNGLLKRLSQ